MKTKIEQNVSKDGYTLILLYNVSLVEPYISTSILDQVPPPPPLFQLVKGRE